MLLEEGLPYTSVMVQGVAGQEADGILGFCSVSSNTPTHSIHGSDCLYLLSISTAYGRY